MPVTDKDLLGFWNLEAAYSEDANGSREWLLGENAKGFIIYEADGNMCAMLQEEGRSMSGGDVPIEEAAQAWHTFFAYSARWELEGDTVRHIVRYAHDPRLLGTTLKRTIHHEGNQLTLSGKHPYEPGRVAYIVWHREVS